MSVRTRLTVVGVLLAAPPVMVACEGPTDTPVASEAIQDIKADQVVFGMTSFITESGVRQGRVDADTAYAFRDSSAIKLVGMKLVFYEDDGRTRATVVADSGSMDERSQRMVAWGDVVLTIHGDGRRIESSELHYDPGTDRIWSDSATVLTRPNGNVTRGTSFQSDLSFNNVRIANPRGAVGEIVF